MSSITTMTRVHEVSPGLWALAWRRLRADRVAMFSLAIVAIFFVLMVLSSVGLIAGDWSREVGTNYAQPTWFKDDIPVAPPPGTTPEVKPQDDPGVTPGAATDAKAGDTKDESSVVDPLADVLKEVRTETANATQAPVVARLDTLPFGADKWGRDVLKKVIKGSETSIFVGLASAIVAVFLGTMLGAVAGFYGRWVDDFLNWFYNIFTSIPYLLLILAIAAVLNKKGMMTIILILGLTGWTGTFRLIRGEYLKHKEREYVRAADAIGASNSRRMFVHIFPNVSHVVLVQLSILVVAFIKSEVILSFLGFGVPVDVVSWGSMLNEAQSEMILGKWWQLAAAGTTMAILVTAFSLFTDALRDALDPKLK
ncbi:MAG: ABC transporter permease [Betaproteobacteria bacterium]